MLYSYYRSNGENNIPENLFLLNSEQDVTHAYKYINSIKNNNKGNFFNYKTLS